MFLKHLEPGDIVKIHGKFGVSLSTSPELEILRRNELALIIKIEGNRCFVLSSRGVTGWVKLERLIDVTDGVNV